MPEIIVQRIHFEDRGGTEFERLALAYLLSVEEWDVIAWYGQLGSDRGKDIWGQLSNRGPRSTVCYQCANHRRLVFSKAIEDIDKISSGPNKIPHKFVMILGGMVSATMRKRVADYASSKGISATEIWSGPEFEERLRRDTPSLVLRFCEGVVFPESVSDLSLFILDGEKLDGDKLLAAYAACFDRPAFTTPFHQESSLPDFKKAMTDTIEALQTGIHRLRDGTIIRRFPAINGANDPEMKERPRGIVVDLQKLRAAYDDLRRQGHVRPCDCGQADCPVHMMSSTACHEMDRLRREILVSCEGLTSNLLFVCGNRHLGDDRTSEAGFPQPVLCRKPLVPVGLFGTNGHGARIRSNLPSWPFQSARAHDPDRLAGLRHPAWAHQSRLEHGKVKT